MRKKGNSKLFKAMMLSAMAMMIMCAHRASAEEMQVYKCMSPSGVVVFQDFACADDLFMQKLKIQINQSADIDPGLRPLEKIMLSKLKHNHLTNQQAPTQNILIITVANIVAKPVR